MQALESGKPFRRAMHRTLDFLRQLYRESLDDRITGEAAKAAYYFFLSLFPLLLALFALTGLFGGQPAFEWIMDWLRRALPDGAAGYLQGFVRQITGSQRPGLLSFSILFTLWSSSHIFVVLADGLNVMYDLEEDRPWWKRRAIALAAVLAGTFLLVGSAAALLAGPDLIAHLGLGGAFHVLRWPMAVLFLTALLWLIYFLLPNRDQRHAARPTLVGAGVGAGVWVLGTLAFRLYVSHFGTYSDTYGFVGGVIVLLLWLYLTALSILFGGEVAATLEQRAREAWAVGEAPARAAGRGEPG